MKRGRDDMDISDDDDQAAISLYGPTKVRTTQETKSTKDKDIDAVKEAIPMIEQDPATCHLFVSKYSAEEVFVHLTPAVRQDILLRLLSVVNYKLTRVHCRLMALIVCRGELFKAVEPCAMERDEHLDMNIEAFYYEAFLESCFPEGSLEVFTYLFHKIYPPDRFEMAMRICLENLEHSKAMVIKQDRRYNREWPHLNPNRQPFSPVGEQILMS